MNKYSFIILNNDVESFLEKLQEIGMVDITRSRKPIDNTSKDLFEKSERASKLLKLLAINEASENGYASKTDFSTKGEEEVLEVMEETFREKDRLSIGLRNLKYNLKEAQNWGDFSKDDIAKIEALEYDIHCYISTEKKFNSQWEEQYILHKLNAVNGKIYFIVLSPKGEPFSFPIIETKLPTIPLLELNTEIKFVEKRISELTKIIAGYSDHKEILSAIIQKNHENLDLYLASNSGIKEAEETILVLEGFAPTSEAHRVEEVLESSSVVYLKDSAKEEDNPPVELKNGWFSKLFEPIGSLYLLPKYDEIDLTRFFAPFYMLFFGLCLGDMGYGLILITLGLIIQKVVPSFKSYAKLVVWLGIGTVIMPILNGTFFGAKIYDFIDMPENITSLFLDDMGMFWFAILFGIFQIIVARIVHAYSLMRKEGFPNGLNEFGWCLALLGCVFMYWNMEVGEQVFSPVLNKSLIFGGLALIILFSKNTRNILKRLSGGVVALWDITSLFGDVLSYIRLFGLGLAGGCLGMVINSLSMQLSAIPYVGWVLCIILLIFGHILVMVLSCISAFVHPIRLTFVEFYKNTGFEGGGREYKPLKKKNQ